MRMLLLILTIGFIRPVYSQAVPAQLSRQLTGGLNSDKEKVNAIFDWITQHISYTVRGVYPGPSPGTEEDQQPLPSLDERVAAQVIARGTAFCDGYARLFKSLCSHAGIEAVCIQGYARSNWKNSPSRFGVNHFWNAVLLDGQWKLLDLTWASGYVSWQEKFVRDIDRSYYLARPEDFIRDHFPDDPRWTLLKDTRVPDEFRHSPFRHKAFGKYQISYFFPQKGLIEATLGDTLRFSISSRKEAQQISPDMAVDTTIFHASPSWVFLQPEPHRPQGVYVYSRVIDRADIEWVSLVYNEDMVLRYKVNIKPSVAGR